MTSFQPLQADHPCLIARTGSQRAAADSHRAATDYQRTAALMNFEVAQLHCTLARNIHDESNAYVDFVKINNIVISIECILVSKFMLALNRNELAETLHYA